MRLIIVDCVREAPCPVCLKNWVPTRIHMICHVRNADYIRTERRINATPPRQRENFLHQLCKEGVITKMRERYTDHICPSCITGGAYYDVMLRKALETELLVRGFRCIDREKEDSIYGYSLWEPGDFKHFCTIGICVFDEKRCSYTVEVGRIRSAHGADDRLERFADVKAIADRICQRAGIQ